MLNELHSDCPGVAEYESVRALVVELERRVDDLKRAAVDVNFSLSDAARDLRGIVAKLEGQPFLEEQTIREVLGERE